MLMVYSFFFNLLISQFCGVYSSLAVDVTGYARLARGEIIVYILKEISRFRVLVGSAFKFRPFGSAETHSNGVNELSHEKKKHITFHYARLVNRDPYNL